MSIAITCHNNLFGTAGQIEISQLADILQQGYKRRMKTLGKLGYKFKKIKK